MRIFSGCLGAFVGVVVAFLCANLVQDAIAGGDTFGGGLYFLFTWPFVLLVGVVLGVAVALRVLRYLQADETGGVTRRKKVYAVAGLALAVAALVGGFIGADQRLTGPPSDDAMLAHFRRHQAIFERVAQMARADKGLDRVDYNWTDPPQPQKVGVSPARLALYRQLLDSAGVHRGFQTGGTAGEIDFYYWLQGSAMSSDTDKGFAYLTRPPAHSLSSLDGCGRNEKNGVQAYRHIAGRWYLFYEYTPG